MPRQPRLVLPGIALHVIQRGNNRAACFGDDRDYLCYLTYLRKLSVKHGCVLHAYCLMTNHVHLLLTPQHSTACMDLMRDLGQSYVKYFNRRHGRSGTLWEGRYRSCIVESPQYVMACYRYIELNPVRAGMVSDPRAYAWSSHAANSGTAIDVLASPHPEYIALADNPPRRCAAYRLLFDKTLSDSVIAAIRDATNGSLPLSSEALKAELAAGGRRIEHRRPGPRPAKDAAGQEVRQIKIVL
jgi:putative transposase